MDWLRSKFASKSALTLPIPSQDTIHQKLPWVKQLYQFNNGNDQQFLDQIANRVWICKRPISNIPGFPLHSDLYFYQKGWNKTYDHVLFVSYHGSGTRVDLSKVQVKEVNLDFYKKCKKKSLKNRNLNNSKIINKALQLSDEKYNQFTNNCNHSADKLINHLQSNKIIQETPQLEQINNTPKNVSKKWNFQLKSKSLQEVQSNSQFNRINFTYTLPIYSISQFYDSLLSPIYFFGSDKMQFSSQTSCDQNYNFNVKCNLQLITGKRQLSFKNLTQVDKYI